MKDELHDGATAPEIHKNAPPARAAAPATEASREVEIVAPRPARQRRFWIDFIPVKDRPRFAHGKVFTTPKTKAAEETVGWVAKQAGCRPQSGPVSVTAEVHVAMPKSWSAEKRERLLGSYAYEDTRDVDNILKAILDGLNDVAYHDDRQVVSASVKKVLSREDGVWIMLHYMGG